LPKDPKGEEKGEKFVQGLGRFKGGKREKTVQTRKRGGENWVFLEGGVKVKAVSFKGGGRKGSNP